MSDEVDLLVVGAGIVGLGHALEAHRRGLRVAVLDRASAVGGASIRNFGHIGVTGQSGAALGHALATRERWLWLAEHAGLWVSSRGGTVVARGDEETALLEAFAQQRGPEQVRLLGPAELRDRTPVRDPLVTSGAAFPLDLQVDPRHAAPALAGWLGREGVRFHWGRAALGIETGVVHTAAGELRAGAVVVAVNADVDQFYPELAAGARISRCGLDMLSLDWTGRPPLATPLLTGSSMLRYSAFTGLGPYEAVRARHARERPRELELGINQMYTQRPDGTLVVGDTHYRGAAVTPFQDEEPFDLLLDLARELFGAEDLRVRQRWQGVYASAPGEFLVEAPADGVRVVSVTTGIGMSTGLGLAASIVGDLFGSVPGRSRV